MNEELTQRDTAVTTIAVNKSGVSVRGSAVMGARPSEAAHVD